MTHGHQLAIATDSLKCLVLTECISIHESVCQLDSTFVYLNLEIQNLKVIAQWGCPWMALGSISSTKEGEKNQGELAAYFSVAPEFSSIPTI